MLKLLDKQDKRGFTIIELLVAIAIIGVLSAIAIPQFSAYRTKSFNSTALSDLRSAATAQEAYYATNMVYADSETNLTSSYGLNISQNVSLSTSGSVTGYTITAFHSSGNKIYTLSGPGGTIGSS